MAFKTKQPNEQQDEGATPARVMAGYGGAEEAQPTMATQLHPGAVQAQFNGARPDSGGSATGYVNFDRFFNANEAGAKSTAGRLTKQIGGVADSARSSLGQVQQAFNQKSQAGTAAGPTQAQRDWAKYGATNVEQPKKVTSAQGGDAATGKQNSLTEEQQVLDSGAPVQRDAAGNVITDANGSAVGGPATPQDQLTPDLEAGIHTGLAGEYSGPTSLDVMEGYGDALKQSHQAQDMLDATKSQYGLKGLLSSEGHQGGYTDQMGAFDAAMTNAAGGADFRNQRDQYGSFEKLFGDAQKQAAATASSAKAASAKNAGEYQGLLDQHEGRVTADKDLATKTEAHSKGVLDRAEASKGDDASDARWVRDGIGEKDSSGNIVWGKGSPPAGFTGTNAEYWQYQSHGTYSYEEATDPKNTMSNFWSDMLGASIDDADYVRSSMTAEDWTAYQQASLTGPSAIRAWFRSILSRRKK